MWQVLRIWKWPIAVAVILILLAVLGLVSNKANAKPKASKPAAAADVAQVVKLMKDPHTRGLLTRKTYPDDHSIQIVFVSSGKRYTFYWSGPGSTNFLSVWARRDGTTRQADMVTFTDDQLDGTVNFGIAGRINDQMLFRDEPDMPQEGLVYRSTWQALYNDAIQAALTKLKQGHLRPKPATTPPKMKRANSDPLL